MANRLAQTEPSVKGKDTNFDFKQLPSWSSDQLSVIRCGFSVHWLLFTEKTPHFPLPMLSKRKSLFSANIANTETAWTFPIQKVR
jgi:hypothetical protein